MSMGSPGRAKNVSLPVQKCWPTVKKSAYQDSVCPRLLSLVHGQVGWVPRLPAAGAGRKADPVIITAFPGSPAVCLPARSRFGEGRGEELHPYS
jgi:hypothetical protein